MTDADMIEALAKNIRGLGYPEARADEWAVLIGDTPEFDGAHLIVRSGSEMVARLPLSAFPDLA